MFYYYLLINLRRLEFNKISEILKIQNNDNSFISAFQILSIMKDISSFIDIFSLFTMMITFLTDKLKD